jgi:hypothetical protein
MNNPQEVPELFSLEFSIKEIHYLIQNIEASKLQGRVCVNKNALSLAINEAAEKKGVAAEAVYSVFHWNIPGPFFGMSFSKIFISERLYQAEIPKSISRRVLSEEIVDGCLEFMLIKSDAKDKVIDS